jgi:hypothetical protein
MKNNKMARIVHSRAASTPVHREPNQASGGLFFGGRTNAIAFQHNIRCAKQIQKEILQAEEGEVLDNEVEDFVVRDLDSLNCAFTALSSACPGLKTFTTVLTYCNDAPAKSLSNCRTIHAIVCMKLFHSVLADYPWEKSRITASLPFNFSHRS